MGKPEGIIENYLIKSSKKHGFLCMKFTSPNLNGVPDRIVIGNGYTIFVEVKKPDGRLDKLQIEIIKQMQKAGAYVVVVYTKDDIDKLLNIISNIKSLTSIDFHNLYNSQPK